MNPYYPFSEWPILVCIGMFLLLIVTLLYAQIVTAGIVVPERVKTGANTENEN